MAGGMASIGVRNQLDILFNFGVVGHLSDSQLLDQYLTGTDGADQMAFGAIVERHGPMVLGVCRQVLGKSHDSEDAFQATFLILASKARSLRKSDSLASWLHGVALRVALRVRTNASRRRVYERHAATLKLLSADPVTLQTETWPELHEEIARLPLHYRQPVVLCYLEGLTTDEAASRIGCPRGTVLSRLSRARERLRARLRRRGLEFPTALVATGKTPHLAAALPTILLDSTVRASLAFGGRRGVEAALACSRVTTLARGVLLTMTVSKLKILGAGALVCALAIGGARSFGQLGRRVAKERTAAVQDSRDPRTALTESLEILEAEFAETARRNTETLREIRNIKLQLNALPADKAKGAAELTPVNLLASALARSPMPALDHLVDVLKRHPPKRGGTDGERMQIYMLDLANGATTLVADEPRPGFTWAGAPRWSHDGSRILFDAAPGTEWSRSHLMLIELHEGDSRPTITDLGPGNCPTFAADDSKIAFLLNPNAIPRAQPGVWIMEADGSRRRFAGEFDGPLWTPNGLEFLVNDFSDTVTRSIVMNLDKMTDGILAVEGDQIFSWPSWAGHETLVSCLATKEEGDTIALLDVSKPAEARIIEVLWKRGPELDVTPRWPVYSPETDRCFFVGVEPNKRTLYSVKRGETRKATRVEADGQNDKLGGLTFSPDGRYLLFGANRPAQGRDGSNP
jgi:RNA polymerase sigma factor (sigma-70 family)